MYRAARQHRGLVTRTRRAKKENRLALPAAVARTGNACISGCCRGLLRITQLAASRLHRRCTSRRSNIHRLVVVAHRADADWRYCLNLCPAPSVRCVADGLV